MIAFLIYFIIIQDRESLLLLSPESEDSFPDCSDEGKRDDLRFTLFPPLLDAACRLRGGELMM